MINPRMREHVIETDEDVTLLQESSPWLALGRGLSVMVLGLSIPFTRVRLLWSVVNVHQIGKR